MADEKGNKKDNRIQVFLVILVLISMGLNVYLFRYDAAQNDQVAVMASWEVTQTKLHEELSSIAETLAQIEVRQVEEVSQKEAAPEGVDKDSWTEANIEIQEALAAITAMLIELETRQSAQESSMEALLETVSAIESRQVEEASHAPESEVVPDESMTAMAPVAEVTYGQDCPITEVRLLPGDSVWSIVARFKSPPSPEVINEVLEFNGITDPRRLPVGFVVKVPTDLVSGHAAR